MKLKNIIFYMTFVNSVNVLAMSSASEMKIKRCMATLLTTESDFHQKHQMYTNNLSDLNLTQNADCKDIQISFKEVSPEAFVSVVTDGHQVWKIDSSKVMTKIK